MSAAGGPAADLRQLSGTANVRNRGVMIPALDPDPESDIYTFGNSGSGFGCCAKWNCKFVTPLVG